jgi:DNA-directed RNA polymerase specialized sigma subunit
MESIIRKVKEARRAIRYSAGRNPSDSEIATMVGASVANVRLARKCSRRVVSLYAVQQKNKANFAVGAMPSHIPFLLRSIHSNYPVIIKTTLAELLVSVFITL